MKLSMEWISVENKLPNTLRNVIVAYIEEQQMWTNVGFYIKDSDTWYNLVYDRYFKVVYWTDMPAPPNL